MRGSEVVPEFCVKFVVIERQESIMEFQVATDVVDFSSEAFEGKSQIIKHKKISK